MIFVWSSEWILSDRWNYFNMIESVWIFGMEVLRSWSLRALSNSTCVNLSFEKHTFLGDRTRSLEIYFAFYNRVYAPLRLVNGWPKLVVWWHRESVKCCIELWTLYVHTFIALYSTFHIDRLIVCHKCPPRYYVKVYTDVDHQRSVGWMGLHNRALI